MPNFIDLIQTLLTLCLPIGAFLMIRRRPGHTRSQLVVAATLGGGIAGAFTASLVAAGGASFGSALPFAWLGLMTGMLVGLLGVGVLALGRWLGREP